MKAGRAPSKLKASGKDGDTFKNPMTGEEHLANIDLPDGFIWKKGECGQGSFHASASGVSVGAEKSTWIFYQFEWSNA